MKTPITIFSLTTLLWSSGILAETAQPLKTIGAQLGETPSSEVMQSVYQENPDFVLNILALLLNSENVDPQVAIEAAFAVAPERAEEIAQFARDAGISNEIITTAALLSGIDPTQIAEATAAGIETAATNAAETITTIAPPSAPAVGSNGGGGEGVVSPN